MTHRRDRSPSDNDDEGLTEPLLVNKPSDGAPSPPKRTLWKIMACLVLNAAIFVYFNYNFANSVGSGIVIYNDYSKWREVQEPKSVWPKPGKIRTESHVYHVTDPLHLFYLYDTYQVFFVYFYNTDLDEEEVPNVHKKEMMCAFDEMASTNLYLKASKDLAFVTSTLTVSQLNLGLHQTPRVIAGYEGRPRDPNLRNPNYPLSSLAYLASIEQDGSHSHAEEREMIQHWVDQVRQMLKRENNIVDTPEEFKQFLNQSTTSFVLFGFQWDPHTARILLAWEDLEHYVEEHNVPVQLGRVFCSPAKNKLTELCQEQNVRSAPFIQLYGANYDGGLGTVRYRGAMYTRNFVEFLAAHGILAQQEAFKDDESQQV